MLLSLPPCADEWLRREAFAQRTLPATLAARLVSEAHARSAGQTEVGPWLELSDWVRTQVDIFRLRRDWDTDIILLVFHLIEKQAIELYIAAEAELGRTALNQGIARLVRTRLGVGVVSRNDRAHVVRVPKNRTTLIKTYSLLEPAKGPTA